jgi:D-hexose-6-phosphate mutarotase
VEAELKGGTEIELMRRHVDGVEGARLELAGGGIESAVVVLAGAPGSARIALQGAQLLAWQPRGQAQVLWCSPMARPGSGKAMRGGIPICWPWFGPHVSDPAQPQHGYARNGVFSLDEIERVPEGWRLRLSLAAGTTQVSGEAEHLSLTIEYLIGAALAVEAETGNAGPVEAPVSFAFHTYFSVGDVRRVRVDGLDGAEYRDNADQGRPKRQAGPLHVAKETVALFDESPARVRLVDPVLGRTIAITRNGCASTVVWNPMAAAASMADIPAGGELGFLCVESGAVGSSAVTLPPGAKHRAGVEYRLDPLAA